MKPASRADLKLLARVLPDDQLAAIALAPARRRGDPGRMKKPGRGGARAGAGRPKLPPAKRTKTSPIYVHAPPALRERIEAVLDPGESLSAFGLSAMEREAAERERSR